MIKKGIHDEENLNSKQKTRNKGWERIIQKEIVHGGRNPKMEANKNPAAGRVQIKGYAVALLESLKQSR